MRAHHSVRLLTAIAALTLATADAAFAQKAPSRGPSSNIGVRAPQRGDGGYHGGGIYGRSYRSGYFAPRVGPVFEEDDIDDGGPQGISRRDHRLRQRSAHG